MSHTKLAIGIVGLPNVGKSTLFKALTKQNVVIANYPFATIDPNMGVVPIPDERLEKLATCSNSKKIIPAVVEFADIAGLVKGSHTGEGLGNAFLSHIQEVDAIAEVIRVFEDHDIIHVAGGPNPVSDIEVLEYELVMKDLESVTKRLDAVRKDIRGNKKGAEQELVMLEEFERALNSGKNIRDTTKESVPIPLLTSKLVMYIFNVSENQFASGWEPNEATKEKIAPHPFVILSAKIESELADLTDAERIQYYHELGIKENGLDQLLRKGYEALGLITFFTTGEDETRAWTIPRGSLAPRAGRAIHSDFEEKFIRAEVIHCEKLLEARSWGKARESGLIRIEGEEYVVQDGDVIIFKI